MVEQHERQSFEPVENSREALFNGLERKVDILRAFKGSIESMSPDDSSDAIGRSLDNFLVSSTSQFPEETQKKFLRYIELLNDSSTPPESIDILDSIEAEMIQLSSDPDVYFLINLEGMVEDLKIKNFQVNAIKDDPDAIKKYAEYVNDKSPDWDLLRDTIITPFSISLVMDSGEMTRIADSDETAGFHISETPINFIRQMRHDNIRKILRHENIHNLVDNVDHLTVTNSYKLESQIADRAIQLDKAIEQGMPGDIVDKQRRLLIEHLSPAYMLNSLHNEMLAHVMNVEENSFQTSKYLEIKDSPDTHTPDVEDPKFYNSTLMYSTAGKLMREAMELLEFLVHEHDGEEIGEICKSALESNKRGWLNLTQDIRQTLSIATRLGEDASTDAHLLFYILTPTQFQYTQRFLEYKYGKDEVKFAEESMLFTDNFQFDIDSFDQIVDSLPQIHDSLTPMDRAICINKFDRLIEGSLTCKDYDISDIDSARKYCQIAERLRGSMSGEVVDKIKSNIISSYCYDSVKNNVLINHDKLDDLYKQLCVTLEELDEDEREEYSEAFQSYLDTELRLDLSNILDKNIGYEKLDEFPIWDVLMKFGIKIFN
jgi:hypothetical protein